MMIPWAKARSVVLRGFARFYLEVLIASVVAVAALGYWWFLRAGFNDVRTVGRYNLLSSQTYERYLRGYADDLWRLDAQLEQFNDQQLKKFSAVVPAEPDLPGLFVQMAALAEASGLTVGSMQFSELAAAPAAPPAASTTPALLATVEISLQIGRGDYLALKRYVANLEANLRILDVQSINFGSEAKGPYAVQLKAYYLPR